MRLRVVVLVALAAAGCAKKKQPEPTPAAKPKSALVERATSVKDEPRQPSVISRVAPIAAEEADGLLPAPAGARELKPVAHAEVGQRLEGSWCYDGGTVAELGAALVAQYTAAGWQQVVLHPNPNFPDRASVSGVKPPYALYANLQRSAREDCRGVDGKTYVSIGMHHLEAVTPAPRGKIGAGARGTTGLRTP